MAPREKACEGGDTVEVSTFGEPMRECLHCGDQCRWDMVDHPFWGFQNCREKAKPQPAGASTQQEGR